MAKLVMRLSGWDLFVPTRSGEKQIADICEGWPPLKVYPDHGLDLEFGPLLLAEEVVLDSRAYDRITCDTAEYLKTAANTLRVLKDKGILRLTNDCELLGKQKERLQNTAEYTLHQPLEWLAEVRESILNWEAMRENLRPYLGARYDITVHIPLGPLKALHQDGKGLTEENYQELRKFLFKRKKKYTKLELDLIKEVARPYLDHVHANFALYEEGQEPIIDWEDIGCFYRKKLKVNTGVSKGFKNIAQEQLPKVRDLFRTASHWEPANVSEFVKIHSTRKIAKLRKEIFRWAEGRTQFDSKFFQDLTVSLDKRHRRNARMGTVINVVGTGLSAATAVLDPAIGAATTAAVAVSLTLGGAQQLATTLSDNFFSRDLGWILCLLDAKKVK